MNNIGLYLKKFLEVLTMTDEKLLSELNNLRNYIGSLSLNKLKKQLEECGVRFCRKDTGEAEKKK